MSHRNDLDAAGCAEKIRKAQRVAALTGAGISTAAGIPDFRGPHGLYVTRRYDPDKIFDASAFHRDPAPFYEFTRDFLGIVHTLKPTLTHLFLADLEAQGRLTAVITQNIDSLHQKAGSQRVISVHGDYWTSHCLSCRREFDLAFMEHAVGDFEVPRCDCGGLIKPDVVFFGEPVHGFDLASVVVADCDLLLVLGSSLSVYPAAFLPEAAGGDVVVVNSGEVALAPGPNRFFVDADLDGFFGEVVQHLAA